MMEFSEPNERLKDRSKCGVFRAQLKMCLLRSECCKDRKHTPRECLNMKDESIVPRECFRLQQSFFDCKHSLLDGRRRFRGPRGAND